MHVIAQGFHSGRCFNKVQCEQTQNGSRCLPFPVFQKMKNVLMGTLLAIAALGLDTKASTGMASWLGR